MRFFFLDKWNIHTPNFAYYINFFLISLYIAICQVSSSKTTCEIIFLRICSILLTFVNLVEFVDFFRFCQIARLFRLYRKILIDYPFCMIYVMMIVTKDKNRKLEQYAGNLFRLAAKSIYVYWHVVSIIVRDYMWRSGNKHTYETTKFLVFLCDSNEWNLLFFSLIANKRNFFKNY